MIHRLIGPLLAGRPVAYFAPTYKMLLPVWRTFRRTLGPVTTEASVQERRIEVIGGGSVDFWSLQSPDSIRGRPYAHAAIDEAGVVPGLEAAWHEVIRPTLADYRGSADLLGTPKGRNFFWTAFNWGQDPGEPEWGCWRFPTVANPFIDPAEVEAARRLMPERSFLQEYLAEFIEDGGGVFRGVNDAIDKGRTAADPPQPGVFYSTGEDIARVQDFTVLTTLDPRGRQAYHERFNQISWERIVASGVRVGKLYPGRVFMDSTGVGDPIYEAVRKQGVSVQPYQFTNASKEALIDNLALGIEQGKFRLMDIPVQTGELLAYQYELTPSRNVRMNAPAGMHDDCVIGLALAAWGLANRKTLRFF